MTVFITRCNFIRHPGQKTSTVKNTQATCVVSREEVPSPIFSLLPAASGTLHLEGVQKDYSTMVSEFLNHFVSRIFTYSFYFDDSVGSSGPHHLFLLLTLFNRVLTVFQQFAA